MAHVISGIEFGVGFLLAMAAFMLVTFKCRKLIDDIARRASQERMRSPASVAPSDA
jgi:hypothetical protein